MKQNINLKKLLKDRRLGAIAKNEKPVTDEAGKGKAAQPPAKLAVGKKTDAPVVETPGRDISNTIQNAESSVEKTVDLTDDEQDSLIDDDDNQNLTNFTIDQSYLRRECKTHLDPSSILSAKKTFR